MANVQLRIGDTAVLEVYIYKNDELMDLDEFLVLFTVKAPFEGAAAVSAYDDTSAIVTKNSDLDGGIEKVSDTKGLIRISLSSYDSKSILDGEYLYDIQISKAGTVDTVITVDSGTITFNKEITTRIAAL
tara:strand:- start:5113 stop:5502 length:390 start_codon:yes stop_codon:yes gene_type:complete